MEVLCPSHLVVEHREMVIFSLDKARNNQTFLRDLLGGRLQGLLPHIFLEGFIGVTSFHCASWGRVFFQLQVLALLQLSLLHTHHKYSQQFGAFWS